jgi:SnoaL-like domain
MRAMSLPADPAAFVAAAERATNERDLEATVGVYAPGARLEALTDGAWERYDGVEEIRRAWTGYLAAMRARNFWLDKALTSAEGDTIVNNWVGGLGGRTDAQGIEYWRFDGEGRVREHRMYSFLNVKPSKSPLQRLRLTLAYPMTAIAFLREQRKARR